MKLYKVDTQNWRVKEVEGEPWPGIDSDGDQCYENTHFNDPEQARERLKKEAEAWLLSTGRQIARLQTNLKELEAEAANATVVFTRLHEVAKHAPPSNP